MIVGGGLMCNTTSTISNGHSSTISLGTTSATATELIATTKLTASVTATGGWTLAISASFSDSPVFITANTSLWYYIYTTAAQSLGTSYVAVQYYDLY